jgi:prepilin-type processing-associated H-X9-DG protein
MNEYSGYRGTGIAPPGSDFTAYGKEQDLGQPGFSEHWIFIDGHEDYIWDETLEFDPNGQSLPFGNRHSNGASVSFADGHVELHKWHDPRSLLPVTYAPASGADVFFQITDDRDCHWIARHGTYSAKYWPQLEDGVN